MFARTVRPALRNVLSRSENNNGRVRSYHEPAHMKQTTIDDLPTPQGSWQNDYNSKQGTYNLHLLAGVLVATGSIIAAKASGLFVMNMSPPEMKKE